MSSSGWLRVAAGLRMVASAAASHVAEHGTEVAARVAHHGGDLAMQNARTATAAISILEEYMQRRTGGQTESHPRKDTTTKHDDTPPPPWPTTERPDTFGNETTFQEPTTSMESLPVPEMSLSSTIVNETVVESISPVDANPVVSNVAATAELPPLPFPENTILSQSPQRSLEEDRKDGRLQEGQSVPSTRVGRAWGFASLGAGLAWGTAAEVTSRLLGNSSSTSGSAMVSDANADRLAASLCRMRGAALKLGQMLSIQDETLLPPTLARALQQVRQGADAMPKHQLMQQLESQLGKDWRDSFDEFDEIPFAAASIGQVHRAKLRVGSDIQNVVMKVQYPGVANSIESDLRNLQMLVTLTGFAPKGLFIEEVMRVGRKELMVECNYLSEMSNQRRFQQLVEADSQLRHERFVVPAVFEELTTSQILTAQFVPGGTIDKVSQLDQHERNRIARNIMYLTMQELFVWRFMQSDPNWGNFLYDVGTRTTYLIDFGAAREFSKSFVDGYLRIVCANANRDEETLMEQSHKLKFLTGEENAIMKEAHKLSGFTVGEPFASDEPFDFRGSKISSRLSEHSSAFMQHRLTPPPEEVYALHRKLAGAYMLCIKLGAVISCRDLLKQVVENHTFDDGMDPPKM